MGGYHEPKVLDVFTDDPPPWACEVFSAEQRDRLTFTKLWQKSVAASVLPKTTKLVALVLSLYFSGGENDTNNPSLDRLARETSLHRSTVVAALGELEDAGLIERDRSRGRVRTRYWLRVPISLQLSDTATVVPDDSNAPEKAQLSDGPTQLSDGPTQLSDFDPSTVVPDDTKGFEGLLEGKTKGGAPDGDPDDPSSEEDSEDQDQGQEPQEHQHLRAGRQFARLLAKGQIDADKVAEIADDLDPDNREQFLQGLREGAVVPV